METTLSRFMTVALFFALFTIPQNGPCAWAGDMTTVSAEGISVIQNGNTAAARDNAVNDALRKAVEQAVGTMISAETVAENYTVLQDRVYSKTRGYVRSYDVLSEMPEGQLYRVRVSAEVGAAEIENDLSALGLLMSRKNMPRVMIMVAEQNIGQTQYVYWWDRTMSTQTDMTITENTLMQKLSEKGFNVVDHTVADKHLELSNAYQIVDLSNDAIKKIGDLYNAEVVIYGKAYAKLRGSVMGTSMKSSMANISLRAVNTDNGGVLASGSTHAAAAHPDEMTAGTEALRQVTEKIAIDMIDRIVNRWSGEVSSGGMIQVAVSGNVDYASLVKLKDAMQSRIRGVKTIYQREFNAGEALLDVEYTGSAHDFADAVTRASFEGIVVQVTGATQNSVSLSIAGH